MELLKLQIESLVFCSDKPLKAEDIKACIDEYLEVQVPLEHIENVLDELLNKYQAEQYPFEIVKLAGGYEYRTKPSFHAVIAVLQKNLSARRLTRAAVETLAIIAYKQPISKPEIEAIRGVGSDYPVKKLLSKNLIEIKGKAQTPGKPVIYGTSELFLEYFGLNSIEELPTLKDFKEEGATIGLTENQQNDV